MTPVHESIENLVNGLVRCHKELADEIEDLYNQGVLLDECQPLKDKAFKVYRLRGLLKDLIEAITRDDFDRQIQL